MSDEADMSPVILTSVVPKITDLPVYLMSKTSQINQEKSRFSDAASSATRKPPAMWTKAEEGAFLDFLLLAIPSSGDGGFKMPAFNQASANLKFKFPHQRGAGKSGLVCKTKWQVVCFY
ncbi:uncharacterized protein F5891DRAFT_1189771 [Suillus fuscotomentosus]|uniref:Uncharacterized protein n=1 Tax=Suillus fuscotomentosus TaxID=1912939 RepID=A0AAD4E428_9AGAM|nr:uncharacterized protein F5891DRAFT_1189771 [Suillus fuscotomentosus]KAG1899335.1 hypothetical protein F5891DRAFT_1189771 [Suillus fuscotomentosus]